LKILITGGKTATALKLVRAFEQAEIILGDYGDMPSIKNSLYSFENLGEWNHDVLAHNLLTKCLDFGVDTLLPLFEREILAVAKSLILFEEFGVKVLVPENPEFVQAKFKDWCVFENGRLVYASIEIEMKVNSHLNGAYFFNRETGDLALISISDSF